MQVKMTPTQRELLDKLAELDDRAYGASIVRAHFLKPLERLWDKQGGLDGMTVEQFVRAAIHGLD